MSQAIIQFENYPRKDEYLRKTIKKLKEACPSSCALTPNSIRLFTSNWGEMVFSHPPAYPHLLRGFPAKLHLVIYNRGRF